MRPAIGEKSGQIKPSPLAHTERGSIKRLTELHYRTRDVATSRPFLNLSAARTPGWQAWPAAKLVGLFARWQKNGLVDALAALCAVPPLIAILYFRAMKLEVVADLNGIRVVNWLVTRHWSSEESRAVDYAPIPFVGPTRPSDPPQREALLALGCGWLDHGPARKETSSLGLSSSSSVGCSRAQTPTAGSRAAQPPCLWLDRVLSNLDQLGSERVRGEEGWKFMRIEARGGEWHHDRRLHRLQCVAIRDAASPGAFDDARRAGTGCEEHGLAAGDGCSRWRQLGWRRPAARRPTLQLHRRAHHVSCRS